MRTTTLIVASVLGALLTYSPTFGDSSSATDASAASPSPTDARVPAAHPIPKPRLAGDLNADGYVDGADLAMLLSQWGKCQIAGAIEAASLESVCNGDLNGDGLVDIDDLVILVGNWR